MEADSETVPAENMEGAYVEIIVDSAENISTESSSEEKDPDGTQVVGYAMDLAEVEVSDITVAGSQENCCSGEAHSDHNQMKKELTPVFVGSGSWKELALNVGGLVSEHVSKESNRETGCQWMKKEPNLEIGSAQVGVLGCSRNGVLAVYYVDKSSIIQLLGACDQDVQPGLFLSLEDTTETAFCNNLYVGSSSAPTVKGVCTKDCSRCSS
ncbi:uncharacterized protein LOC144509215 [Mustelus asterias]